jgi:hypothetical protein
MSGNWFSPEMKGFLGDKLKNYQSVQKTITTDQLEKIRPLFISYYEVEMKKDKNERIVFSDAIGGSVIEILTPKDAAFKPKTTAGDNDLLFVFCPLLEQDIQIFASTELFTKMGANQKDKGEKIKLLRGRMTPKYKDINASGYPKKLNEYLKIKGVDNLDDIDKDTYVTQYTFNAWQVIM